ncbi:MAG: glutaminyl-peptide cyclotransferase [Anaerolineae bacterium]|nr:glutaminyl-peptide cyclotransferase [Anaerolineae bacterium]
MPPPSPTAATTPTETPSVSNLEQSATTPLYTYEVVESYPHDPMAFTQGLIIVDSIMYEGTGRYEQSTLRRVDLKSGESLQLIHLPDQLFGEGITLFDDRIIQLTWKAGAAFVYNKDTFEPIKAFTYPTEGWGITHDGKRLIMSDGTANLYFRDPETFEEIGRVEVFDENGPVVMLNELEYINGEVFANVWKTDKIARIDPETGRVTGWILLTDLLSPEELTTPSDMQNGIAVLNGIAYDADNDRLFITGKLWPTLFEIKIVPVDQ